MTLSDAEPWTLDQLAEQVESALAVGYGGPANGRVRGVPDRRAIRWYTTIGLVDRPLAMRGRTALYGERHLLQLVAIKRRQAEGRSLAEIQAELTGATDMVLRLIAQLPPGTGAPAGATPAPRTDRFWSTVPIRVDPMDVHSPPASSRTPPAPTLPLPAPPSAEPAAVSSAVLLPGGVTLVLPPGGAAPDPDQLRDIRAAATPLLSELLRLGLVPPGVIETDQREGPI
jgi:hypothetical protein